ncbi:MAG TPA: dienelactone hydrolase family protein [Chitinophagales bacterium]|nr:dienelactone hydrolase family protein [Chitinophagales bacterium]
MKRAIPFFVFVLFASFLTPWCINTASAQFPIGHTTLTFTDPSRSNREIPCEVYYPAVVAGDDQPVHAPLGSEQYPVVVFGHGFVMGVDAYGYLQNALAAEGYIAVFPSTETGFAPNHTEFAKDLAFAALSMIDQSNSAASIFHQRVSGYMASMGHSMGGGAAMLSFQYNPDFKTVFTLAAAETNPSAVSAATGITVPLVYMVGDNDCITPLADHQLPMYNAGSTCRFLVNVDEGTHCQFSSGNFACETGETLTGCADGVAEATQHNIVLQWLLPWLDLHLRNNVSVAATINALVGTPVGYTVLDACTNLNTTEPKQTGFNVSPNNDGSYNVSLKDATLLNTTYALMGTDGKTISTGTFIQSNTTLDTNGLANGVYLLQPAAGRAIKLVVAR